MPVLQKIRCRLYADRYGVPPGVERQAVKTNPKRIPKTQADVDRAYSDGMDFGLEFALNLVLYVLKDKHDAPDNEIMQLRDEFMYVVDSVGKKYLSYSDIVNTLSGEYDLRVRLSK